MSDDHDKKTGLDSDNADAGAALEADAGAAGNGHKNGGGSVSSEDDEPVGYGRPPRRHQFKPGQSGNRRGRPQSARGLKTLLREEMNERVRVTENGKTKSLSKLQIIIKRLSEKAAKGDARSIGKLIELNIEIFGIEDDTVKEVPLTREEEEILATLKRRRAGGDAEAGQAPALADDDDEQHEAGEGSRSGGGDE